MYAMITKFNNDVLTKITRYEKRKGEDLSETRSKDILTIRGILQQCRQQPRDIDATIEAIERPLSQFKTGLRIPVFDIWVWDTENSELRDSIREVIKAYQQPLAQLLLTKIAELETQNTRFEEQRRQQKPSALQSQLKQKDEVIKTLSIKLTRAQQDYKEAKEEGQSFKHKNGQLCEQLARATQEGGKSPGILPKENAWHVSNINALDVLTIVLRDKPAHQDWLFTKIHRG